MTVNINTISHKINNLAISKKRHKKIYMDLINEALEKFKPNKIDDICSIFNKSTIYDQKKITVVTEKKNMSNIKTSVPKYVC